MEYFDASMNCRTDADRPPGAPPCHTAGSADNVVGQTLRPIYGSRPLQTGRSTVEAQKTITPVMQEDS